MTVADAIRRPEYTGPNRCWPCTILNVLLLAGAAVVAGAAWLPAGVAVAAVGATVIWLRGYLVPYTPDVAPRLAHRLPVPFESSPLVSFDSLPGDPPAGEPGTLSGSGPSDPDAVLAALLDAGVLVAEGEQIALSTAFADAWERERDRLGDLSGSDLAAATAEAAPGDPETALHRIDSGEWVRLSGEPDVILSRPVAIAEIAAVEALADADLDGETKATAASSLRAFLDTCPVCGVELVESSTADCCGGRKSDPRPVLSCPECDRALYTFPER